MVQSLMDQELAPATSILIGNDGTPVEYLEQGSGPPIVLVPGLAGGLTLIRPLMHELAKTHRVIAYQLRGEGNHLFDRCLGFRQHVSDLKNVIDALCLETPTLIGVSFGGAVAMEFASQYSARISRLIVQGTASTYRPGIFGGVARATLERVPLPTTSPFINQFFRLMTGVSSRGLAVLDAVTEAFWQTDQMVIAHRLASLDHYDVSDRLWSINVPTLVMSGADDAVVTVAELIQLARALPFGRYQQLADAGHLAYVSHPSEFANAVCSFSQMLDLALV